MKRKIKGKVALSSATAADLYEGAYVINKNYVCKVLDAKDEHNIKVCIVKAPNIITYHQLDELYIIVVEFDNQETILATNQWQEVLDKNLLHSKDRVIVDISNFGEPLEEGTIIEIVKPVDLYNELRKLGSLTSDQCMEIEELINKYYIPK